LKIAFRADASTVIGTGHVMRCMALALAARGQGAEVQFVCRAHEGHLAALLQAQGFAVALLPSPQGMTPAAGDMYAEWLGVPQSLDAQETAAVLRGGAVDWVVVDHYALDEQWERAMQGVAARIAVIDDLANRGHDCSLLLDQSLDDSGPARYRALVPTDCTLLLGPNYALLRPEFAAARKESLARRRQPLLERVLLFMGGSDPQDETSRALQGVALAARKLRHVDIVVGQAYRGLERLREGIHASGLPAQLHVQTGDMARLMAQADLAITAGGGVSWEKCTLGLPSLVVIVGDNQHLIAHALAAAGAQVTLGWAHAVSPQDYAKQLDRLDEAALAEMSLRAAAICDGGGTQRVLEHLLNDAG